MGGSLLLRCHLRMRTWPCMGCPMSIAQHAPRSFCLRQLFFEISLDLKGNCQRARRSLKLSDRCSLTPAMCYFQCTPPYLPTTQFLHSNPRRLRTIAEINNHDDNQRKMKDKYRAFLHSHHHESSRKCLMGMPCSFSAAFTAISVSA